MAIFAAKGAGFAYPGFEPSLVGIDFEIGEGERVALLGANGSGKSTLLHLLDGLYFATEGRISAFGETLSEAALDRTEFGPRFRKEVAFLFQNADVQLFNSTVREELAYGPLQLDIPREQIESRISDTMELLGISGLAERSPEALSAGQKKLVAFGSILTLAPGVILLDEPTAGLDARSEAKMLDVLGALSQSGRTIVSATHHVDVLPDLADRAIVLGEDHRVRYDGPVASILTDLAFLQEMNLRRPRRTPSEC
ncbi:MAG TPA: ABC transporter ATP-binding protein [Fimbriimonadaceae bacterium]|nr:ABC transporter ATP-binding protein [Fimbriimonadaceae bacterium]